MRLKIQSGSVAAFAVALAASLPPVAAQADGPHAAYDNGGDSTDASLDPGEEQVTADEENKARLQDLSDAYHNGYNARAKEDAETYASLRDQLKTPPRTPASDDVPPLPDTMPDGDDARVTPIPSSQVAQRAMPVQQASTRLPPAQQYTMAQSYPQAAAYSPPPVYQAPPPPVYQQPVIVQQAYAPPPPPPVVQYVPVVAQADYAPPPVYQPPVVTVAAPVWSGYPPGYWGGYPRAYGYGVWR